MAYAVLYVLAMFSFTRLILNLTSWTALWALAVLMPFLGYLLPRHGYKEDWVSYLAPARAVLGFTLAVTVGGAWLTLV